VRYKSCALLCARAKGPRPRCPRLAGIVVAYANYRICRHSTRPARLPGRVDRITLKGNLFAAGVSAVAAPPTVNSPKTSGPDVTPKDAPLPSLFPNPPAEDANEPKLKAVIIGAGLAGFSTAVELADRGYEVEIYDQRPFMGGKVASWQDKDGNHIEMGLHVFFGCYFNLFRLMAKCGVVANLLLKDHAHTFVNENGDVRLLDFRFNVGDFKVGAPFHGLKAFFTTPQLSALDKAQNALALGTSPVVRAVIDPEGGMRDVRKLDGVSFEDWFLSHGAILCRNSLIPSGIYRTQSAWTCSSTWKCISCSDALIGI
jgi:zeta-carotene desaturase